MTAHGVAPDARRIRRRATRLILVALLISSLLDAIRYYWLIRGGALTSGAPLPLSLLVSLGLFAVLRAVGRQSPEFRATRPLFLATLFGILLAGFPLLQMVCFGRTDYRRPADVIVVFGARAYANGQPSDALADRVRTGCELYRQGLASSLIFSGGPGDGAIHETEAMRRMAHGLGVPDAAIRLDRNGVNTQATVRNTRRMLGPLAGRKLLVVSHAFHLPRVKLAYRRAQLEVYTVPCRETYVLRSMPYLMLRETAALWFYYLRPIASQ